MLPSHYSRFCTSAGLGVLSKEKRTFFKMYKTFVQQEYEDSISTALLEKIGMYEDLDGIDIITDARHGWRKNAKDTSVVAVGETSHKILNCVHITTADDSVTQRHEKIGTEKIYRDLEAEQVTVQINTNDRNLSINKMVKETVSTTNQNDILYGIKSVKKAMSLVSSGPRYKEGKTWSEELYDKPEPVATHFNWAIKN